MVTWVLFKFGNHRACLTVWGKLKFREGNYSVIEITLNSDIEITLNSESEDLGLITVSPTF